MLLDVGDAACACAGRLGRTCMMADRITLQWREGGVGAALLEVAAAPQNRYDNEGVSTMSRQVRGPNLGDRKTASQPEPAAQMKCRGTTQLCRMPRCVPSAVS